MKRISKTKLNIVTSLLLQVVTGVCGLILPRFILWNFGSEVNGLVSSVSEFLGYAVLLEGGISGVMKAALYKPLADGDDAGVSSIFYQIRRTFKKIALIFIGFVLVLSISMRFILDTQHSWFYVFSLVLILGAPMFFNYYGSMPYQILMTADQKLYLLQFTQIAVAVSRVLLCMWVMHLGGGIHAVKLIFGLIFLLNPLVQQFYVKRHYHLSEDCAANVALSIQKRDGITHHLSYFVHRNTDIFILSLLGSLHLVSVYTVHKMVINVLENLLGSISSGLSGLIGRLLAKEEASELNRIVDRYEACNNMLATAFMTVCAMLMTPFVAIYTGGVTDAQYHQPVFAILLIAASYVYSIRHPFISVVAAAGHYKETKLAAVGEGVINLVLSLALVKPFGLVGVALGTFVSMTFRTLYTVWYLSKHILYRPVWRFLVKVLCNVAVGVILIDQIPLYLNVTASNIFGLLVCAIKVSLIVFPVFAVVNVLLSLQLIKAEIQKKRIG